MPFALNRVVNLEDFAEPRVREAIREVFASEAAASEAFPTGFEQRKHWEIAMAILALREGGVLRGDAEVLGIGAGSEATLFWLTNHVRRVWATDLYAAPGEWETTAQPVMLTDPGRAWDGPWNPKRLVAQHMDACELSYEDEMFDGIFSSGSIEHFGSLDRISVAMDEAFRVLKPGGTISLSTEYLISGDPLLYEEQTVMFTPELIDRVLLGDRDWALVTPIDYTLSDATLQTEVSSEVVQVGAPLPYPHCVLRIGPNVLTSVHITLRKAARASSIKVASPSGSPIVVSGPRTDVGALAAHLPDPLVLLDAGCRGGFPARWELLGEHARLVGFDADREECERLNEQYAGRTEVEFVSRALGSKRAKADLRRVMFAGGTSLHEPDSDWLGLRTPVELDAVEKIVEVDIDTIDEWCGERDIGRVDALKLDVQGHELEVLRGASARLADVRAVEVEVWFNPGYAGTPLYGEVDALLREHGFVLWRLGEQAHYPIAGGEGAPGSTEYVYPGDRHIAIELPSGMLTWANAQFVRREIFAPESTLPWQVRLRDALLMNGLCFHDLALISLRRLLDEQPPESLASDVRKVLAVSFEAAASGGEPAADTSPEPERHAAPDRVEASAPAASEPDAGALSQAPIRVQSQRRSAAAILRRVARLPYHPILWRLNRNYEHASIRSGAVEARLADVQEREAAVQARLAEMQRAVDARLDDMQRAVETRLAHVQRNHDEWGLRVQHGLSASRDAIDVAQRTIRETRAVNDDSREAIAEWSAMLARELGENGHDTG